MSDKNVKTNLADHSAAKVQLLGGYLKRFLNIIANDGYTKRIRIYDLFCGEGIYGNLGEGSPIVIMRTVKDVYFTQSAKSKQTPTIDCYFNDIDGQKVEKVKHAIKTEHLHYPQIGGINFSDRNYDEVIRELSDELPRNRVEKVFIFIDPNGYKHIRASDIKALLSKGNTEVLLFLPTQFMYRFDANGTPEALIDFIEEIVDYKQWNTTESVWSFIEQLKTAFRTNLGPTVFVDTFTIHKDPQTVFCLFFFSSHIRGFEKMLEAKWDLDMEQGKGWNYKSSQQNSLFSQLKTHPLEENLRTFLQDSERNNKEVYQLTLHCGFLPKHTREVFASLQNEGVLNVLDGNGANVRKGSFYINYKDSKENPDKVRFSII